MIAILILLFFFQTTQSADVASQEFAKGNLKFTADVYKDLANSTNGNLIISPLSAEIILALTAEGARGTTKRQLTTALHLPSTQQTRLAVSRLNLNVSTENLKVLSANRIYIAENFTVEQPFLDIARQYYKAGLQNVDFADNQNTAKLISDWVAQNTNNRIQNLISSDVLSAATKLVLVNALYFKGLWARPFLPRNTRKENFYTSCQSNKSIDMMHSENFDVFRYYYSPCLNTKFLELAYQNTNITMTFVLHDDIDGLSIIEEDLEAYLRPKPYTVERVAVTLPLFNISQTINFRQVLQTLGVTNLFENNADLSGISQAVGLKVDFVVQKAYIGINEKGTEAAAATAGGLIPTSVSQDPTLNFTANHPFIFYIRDNKSGNILFVGRFTG